ncbi:unnamed protein product [Rotaria sp. Silwood2]|nr:unnamed protein product [Rotaria sp. Silwood2]
MIMPRLSKLNSVFNLLFYYRCVSSEIEIDSKFFYNVIGGGTDASRDAIRNAFALLINPDQSICDMIFKHCNIDCRYLVNHLINKIIIIKSIACAQTKEELELMRSDYSLEPRSNDDPDEDEDDNDDDEDELEHEHIDG